MGGAGSPTPGKAGPCPSSRKQAPQSPGPGTGRERQPGHSYSLRGIREQGTGAPKLGTGRTIIHHGGSRCAWVPDQQASWGVPPRQRGMSPGVGLSLGASCPGPLRLLPTNHVLPGQVSGGSSGKASVALGDIAAPTEDPTVRSTREVKGASRDWWAGWENRPQLRG